MMIFSMKLTGNKLRQILSTDFNFREKDRLVHQLWPFGFFRNIELVRKIIIARKVGLGVKIW
jgi:hypothetical protein